MLICFSLNSGAVPIRANTRTNGQ
ncbi:hypothetical protein YPPY01_2062, partial [Yersinia pestis PY-01]